MKPACCEARLNRARALQGVMLIECLVYIALVMVILGVAFAVFYHCADHYLGLRRNAEDITRALHAGERWREDVRRAISPVQSLTSKTGSLLRIPQATSVVSYQFTSTNVWRFAGSNSPPQLVLDRVQSSVMRIEQRSRVECCVWELELRPRRKGPRVRPRFSFLSVPQTRPVQ